LSEVGDLKGSVRNCVRDVKKERIVTVLADKTKCFFCEQVVGVIGLRWLLVAFEDDFLVVSPEVRGIICVRLSLAVIAEEVIEALIDRIALGAGIAESPFADDGRGVAGLFENLGDCLGVRWDRNVALDGQRFVITDEAMARVEACYQNAS
jgi:hypothetical protein